MSRGQLCSNPNNYDSMVMIQEVLLNKFKDKSAIAGQ